MHDILKKKRNYIPWAIAAGAVLLIASIFFKSTDRAATSNAGPRKNEKSAAVPSGKTPVKVSEEMIGAMLDAAVLENPALRENIDAVREEIRRGVAEQELIVAEAIDKGLASSDPIARNRLRELIIFSIYQEADIGLTPEAIRKYYEENKSKYYQEQSRLVQHLFVRVTNLVDDAKALETLDKIFKEATGPESRQSDAVKKAIAPVWVTPAEVRMQFGPTFSGNLFAQPMGEWSEAIASTSGKHRVRVIEEKPARQRPFGEVQSEVESDLRQKSRQEAYRREIERLSKKYEIKFLK